MPPTLGTLNADLPIALFPVRLETRFDAAKLNLLVRIYPDSVHVDSFETELTPTEIEWGQAFWKQTWLAGRDEGRARAAWARLAGFFGPLRAAWIAEELTPKNPNDQPQASLSPEADLPVAPQFRTVSTRKKAWNRAPYTRVLPDKWIARGYLNEKLVLNVEGKPITLPLHLGLNPKDDVDESEEKDDVDENEEEVRKVEDLRALRTNKELGWLIDFGKAEEVGMGLRIPLPTDPSNPQARIQGLDRLIVLGVNTRSAEANGQTEIEQLLRAHHHTGGLGFVLQGTPTNNTKDVSSGYRSVDPDFKFSYGIERRSSPSALDGTTSALDGTNRAVTARALGIADTCLAHLEESYEREQTDAEAINRVLWPATWGYFLEQLMAGPDAPSPEAIQEARAHFVGYVRARGPLPALRVGTQPYGVLPVIALDLWKSLKGDSVIDAPMVAFLQKLRREVWRKGLDSVPRVSLGPEDPFKRLFDILAMTAVSADYAVRRGQRVGLVSPSPPGPKAHETGSQAAKALAARLGLSWIPSQIRMMMEPGALTLAADVVYPIKTDATAPETEQTESASEAIGRLLTSNLYAEIESPVVTISKRPTLLSIVLRDACLQTYMQTAVRLLTVRNAITQEERIWEREWVPEAHSSLPFKLLKKSLGSGPLPTFQSVGKFLDNLKMELRVRDFELERVPDVPPDFLKYLEEFGLFFRDLHTLASKSDDVLDRLFRESLDLCSHRFDAWVTSFASKRLEQIRAKPPNSNGIHIGGYGWVENLEPAASREVVEPPKGLTFPTDGPKLYSSKNNQGYVHAPSLAHATTAALLRSGYVSLNDEDDPAAFAVNLSSRRVRLALTLLEGVRQGQSLGALLGYRFERGLHENHPGQVLDVYIPAFRRLAPLEGTAATADSELNIRATANVVDGLVLLKKFQLSKADPPVPFPWGIGGLPSIKLPTGMQPSTHEACLRELENLEDAVDAISDLVLAESVHHVAQGNPVRAGATLDAIALGEAPPPELDVVRTPRSGISITHRLSVLICGDPAETTWAAETERAKAEPALNAWAAQLLGEKAETAVCRVEYLDVSKKEAPRVVAQRYVPFKDLKLAPIDVVYLPEGEAEAQRSELELRVCHYAMANSPQALPNLVDLRLSFVQSPDDSAWPAGTTSFAEVLEVARAIRRLVTEARPLKPKDLSLPEATVLPDEENKAAEDVEKRAKAAVSAFIEAHETLKQALPEDKTAGIDRGRVEGGLFRLAQFGVAGAIPEHDLLVPDRNGKPFNLLRTRAESALRDAERCLSRLKKLEDDYEGGRTTAAPSTTNAYHMARLGEVFGPHFRVMPRFTLADSRALGRSLEASTALQGGNPLESTIWLQRVARVREAALRLDTVMLYGEALNRESLRLTVGQLPYDPSKEERWAALPGQLSGSRLSIVSLVQGKLDLGLPLAGLLIDEWIEVVPSKEETTGLSFHFDSPQSRPPQAILLAVPPDDQPTWTLDVLAATIQETLELAKLRTVDLSHLKEIDGLGAFLPALFFAQNKSGSPIVSNLPRRENKNEP